VTVCAILTKWDHQHSRERHTQTEGGRQTDRPTERERESYMFNSKQQQTRASGYKQHNLQYHLVVEHQILTVAEEQMNPTNALQMMTMMMMMMMMMMMPVTTTTTAVMMMVMLTKKKKMMMKKKLLLMLMPMLVLMLMLIQQELHLMI